MINSSTPFNIQVYRRATKSNHPVLLGLPVVAPNSFPCFRNHSPSSPKSSVGNGPEPTRVQYALKIPYTLPICLGAIPNPLQTPESVQRNSLALYYFSDEHSKVKMKPTNYRPRPVDGRRGASLKVDNAALSLYSRLRVSLGINDQSMGKLLGKFRRKK